MRLKLYFASGANCSDRVRWVLGYKGISYEAIDVDAIDDATFLSIDPFGRVPLLLVDDAPLTESMAIVEYLETLYPKPSLMSQHAFEQARIREVCEAVNSSIHPVQNSRVVQTIRPDWTKEEVRLFRSDWIASNLEKLKPLLWRSSAYAIGDHFTLADIFIAVIYRKGVELAGGIFEVPSFRSHWDFLMSQPSIAASCPE